MIKTLFALLVVSVMGAYDVSWGKEQDWYIRDNIKSVTQNGDQFQIETKNFVITTEVDRTFTIKTGCFMEMVRKSLIGTFGLTQKIQVKEKPKVFIVSNLARYHEILGQQSNSRGWFRYTFDGKGAFPEFSLYSYIKREEEREFERFYVPILIHEGVHLILQQYAGKYKIPNIYNEAIASYMQSWDLNKDFNYNQKNRKSAYLRSIQGGIGKDDLVRLNELFDVDVWDIDNFGRKTNVRYFISEMFVEYLVGCNEGKNLLKSMTNEILDGKYTKGEFSKQLDKMQSDFDGFVIKQQSLR